jgi:hypothetical protein
LKYLMFTNKIPKATSYYYCSNLQALKYKNIKLLTQKYFIKTKKIRTSI